MAVSLSQRSSIVFVLSVQFRRFRRKIQWVRDRSIFALRKSDEQLLYEVFNHSSLLIRRLEGVDLQLQYNKVKNLQIASNHIHQLLIKPGEKFSLYRLLGKPSNKRGFEKGLELSRGKMEGAIGGGLCQVANILHWMVLHSDMDMIERHHHSVDIFPDSGRIVPFGTGATLFYNFKDFVFQNNTNRTYQLLLYLDDEYLQGKILTDDSLHEQYQVFEKAHSFSKVGDDFYRENEIWRKDLKSGKEELLFANKYKTLYTPSVEVL
ncbi:MAG: VanW family protein [Bacteroidales bacterium]|nr:VanW family protein [Bacteroidales bacterium]